MDLLLTALAGSDLPKGSIGQYSDSALYFAYLARIRNDDLLAAEAVDRLNAAIGFANAGSSPGIHAGITGLGWKVAHVASVLASAPQSRGRPDIAHLLASIVELNSEIDNYLADRIRRASANTNYDLISGLAGWGVYLLDMQPSPASRERLGEILSLFESSAETLGDCIRWHTNPVLLPDWQRELSPDGYYNLGLAHGIPGTLYFFAELIANGLNQDRAYRLLNGGMRWLASQQHRFRLVQFDSWIPSGPEPPNRLAWCYNDLGIAGALAHVVRRAQCPEWNGFVGDVLDHCIAVAHECESRDAAVCHGTAGAAHIFNRLYHIGSNPGCRQAALEYFERTLTRLESGTLGSDNFPPPPQPGSLLRGLTGVGLALLGALTSLEPRWDRLLFIS